MADQRAMTLRLDEDLALQVDIIAGITGATVADFIREAVRTHVQTQRLSPTFQTDATAYIDRQRRALFGDEPPTVRPPR